MLRNEQIEYINMQCYRRAETEVYIMVVDE